MKKTFILLLITLPLAHTAQGQNTLVPEYSEV